jgi:DNA-binding transcriptional LysR family regulator
VYPSAAILLDRVLARCSLRHLQALLVIAETGSVQRAAEAIGVSPSSLQHTLSHLEAILATELFRHDGQALQPTPACSTLLPHARQIMTGLAEGADALVTLHRSERILVRVLASSPAAGNLLAHALPAFTARYARVQVQWREADGEDPAPAMQRGEVDLVAGRRPPAIPEGWGFRELLTDRFVAVCAPDHPLAGRNKVSWDDLARQAWLLPPTDSDARERFDDLMARAGTTPASYCVLTSVNDMADWLLHDHEMLAFVPMTEVLHLLVEGDLVQLCPEDRCQESLGLLQPRSASEPALRLAGFLQHFAASPPEPASVGWR